MSPEGGRNGSSTVGMTIREATAGDYDTLCGIIETVDALHRERHPDIFQKPDGPVRDRGYILDLIYDEDAGFFVAEIEGRLAGFVKVLIVDSPAIPIAVPRRYAVIDNLAVREELQRAGIGRALMQTASRWAVSRGATSMELNVYEFNTSAIAFYRALGYETHSRRMSRPLEQDTERSPTGTI
jgi:ribosomal protein S18 acetylase RimI-like enzyme